MPRPINLIDTVHDFGPNNDIPLSLTINTSSFSEAYSIYSTADWNKYTTANLSIKNFHSVNNASIPSDINNTPTADFVDSNGNKIPPSTNFSTITYRLVSTSPTNTTEVSPTVAQVTLLNTRPNSNINFKNGIINSPGSYISTHYFYMRLPVQIPGNLVIWNKFSSVRYFYNVFQKSVAVIEDVTSSAVVVNTQTKSNVNLNDKIRVSKSKSRGKDVSSDWVVQVRDSGGNFITAVQGVDYNITFGTLGSDVFEIEVLQAKVFKIICNVAGFTSSTNTFYSPAGTGDVTINSDSTFYLIDASSASNNTQDIITLPKIKSIVTIQNQTTNNPVQTGYTGATITVNGEVDTATGVYIIKDLNTQSDTTVTLSPAQWTQEINTRTNIILEIRNKVNGTVMLSKPGIGPHENITLPVGSYLVQYKTVLK